MQARGGACSLGPVQFCQYLPARQADVQRLGQHRGRNGRDEDERHPEKTELFLGNSLRLFRDRNG